MDETRQDKKGNKQIAPKEKLWIPSLSPNEQKKAERLQKKTLAERIVAGKTLWDWIQLALQIVGAFAVLLTLISLIVNVQQFKEQQRSENDRTIQQQRNEQSRTIDQQQQTTLETYLDRMSDLLFTQHLDTSQRGAEVRQVARARTLTALQNLNPARKAILLQFLYESRLIGYYDSARQTLQNAIIDLRGANLQGVDLRGANLQGVDLRGANLQGVDLRSAHLSGAHLSGADLSGANLHAAGLVDADLSGAYLRDADLSGAYLRDADLRGANLQGVDLRGANLQGVDLRSAHLSGAHLSGAYLRDADLRGAYLRDADLRGAYMSRAHLSGADLSGANLSDTYLHGTDLITAKLDNTRLKGARYNTKEILLKDSQGKIVVRFPPTQWPQGFDPKAAGAIERNTWP